VDAVIKVGGSLAEHPATLKTLGIELCRLAKNHQITVVPGGDKFADVIRDLDAKFALPAVVTHRMAILAMDQYGLLLSQVIPDCHVCDSLEAALEISSKGQVGVFLPTKLLSAYDPFEPSWDVTSDSISAYIAVKLNALNAIFVTDVDGVFTKDPKSQSDAALMKTISTYELIKFHKRTSVDKFLPKFLMKNPLSCYVVNGRFPERLSAILSGQKVICTRITLGK
jgi:5-(aminomethyl)-3-furanmethanol phosphate kinase